MNDSLGNSVQSTWRFIGLSGPLAVALILLSSSMVSLQLIEGMASELSFFAGLFVSAALTAIAVSAASALFDWKPKGLINGGSFVALAGMACYWAAQSLNPAEAGAALSGGVLGVGLCYSFIRWGSVYATLRERSLVVQVAFSILVASIVELLVVVFVGSSGPGLYIVLSLCLLASCILPSQDCEYVAIRGEASPSQQGISRNLFEPLLRQWKILGCFLLCLTIFAATSSARLFSLSISTDLVSVESVVGVTLGLMMSSVVLLVLVRYISQKSFHTLYQVVPLVCVATILVGWFFSGPSGVVGRFISSMTLGLSLGVSGALLWSRILISRAASPLSILCLAAAACALFLLALLFLWPLVGDAFMNAIDLGLMVVFLAVAAIEMMVTQRGHDEINRPDHGSLLGEQCERLSAEYQLTKREEEILVLVVQGRAAPYIAERLFVSSNTVKTHIRRMYAKVGVHSKEELLDLIYK